MIRILALFGMAAGFLMISPKLRDTVFSAFSSSVQGLDQYSPYSYVALAVVVLSTFVVSLKRGSQPR